MALVALEVLADLSLAVGRQSIEGPAGRVDSRQHDFRVQAFLVFHLHQAHDDPADELSIG
jgi:hypothetical protein